MYNSFKRKIEDWACDTDGLNSRKKEVIDKILPLLEEIEALWDSSLSRSSAEQEKFNAEMEVLKICNNNELLKVYYDGTYFRLRDAFIEIGEDSLKASLLALRRITINIGAPLSNQNILLLYTALNNLTQILDMSDSIRHRIYADNAQKIYNNIFLLNSFKKKFLDLSSFLGEPVDVDEMLGLGGSKIKALDVRSLSYIDKILELANKFRTELSLINARDIAKK
ncbi:MAG: hypothetical protein NC483_00030 [Ruminococcus sp.]|nr:hypothetical protein [Ruminococcus sp.]